MRILFVGDECNHARKLAQLLIPAEWYILDHRPFDRLLAWHLCDQRPDVIGGIGYLARLGSLVSGPDLDELWVWIENGLTDQFKTLIRKATDAGHLVRLYERNTWQS